MNRIIAAVEFIDNNYHQKINIGILSRKFGVSYYYLPRLFKLKTGKTINKYIQEKRVNRAAELLKTKKMSCKEAAFRAGFQSIYRFNRVFRKNFNIVPSKFN